MKGILFTEILFHKVVDKTKTQTRRGGKSLAVINENPDKWTLKAFGAPNGEPLALLLNLDGNEDKTIVVKPRYEVGDILFLKEPYHLLGEDETGIDIIYKYDDNDAKKWANKLFMPQRYARYFARVTDVKLERLYSISDEDCMKEGVDVRYYDEPFELITEPYEAMNYQTMEYDFDLTYQESYFSLFRFANKIPKSREVPDQFVWVYDFCLCDKDGREV